ncbi:uncharacterized protein Z518_09561 [Rhinocladiella mackenziei CBS 650.93]|uniref:Uncharacterized protein n=1 Tax=Rhinocladiella mackenziei CBS 650.93 TaxID=1442369 RepID=A0A0D2I7K3_9EURO|nr:uncharacterized protein Z518_09561 [Rhinocladiella mackenziei CBS 650.93]KIX01834.1 hypothetical protein Z518_09561 [Rhinocladiella mackenziei CBS 650.93]
MRTPSPRKPNSSTPDPALNQTSIPPSRSTAAQSFSSPAPPLSSAQRLYVTRQAELQRFRRLFRRLAWKANSLTHWSHRALNLAQEHQSQFHSQNHPDPPPHAHPVSGHGYPDPSPRASLGRYEMIIDPVEAERQFKIDFYEFYTLLERGLVCLLGVWGIVITSTAPTNTTGQIPPAYSTNPQKQASRMPEPIIGDSRTFHGASHRFHANVLDALDHPSNPLHEILGTGDAREYIGVAKEFRNKWKDVEQRPDDSFHGHERAEEEWDRGKVKRYEKVLQDLQLDVLLGTVLAALEEAGRRAEGEVARLKNMLGKPPGGEHGMSVGVDDGDGDFDMEDAPFESLAERIDFDYEMEC